MSPYAGAVKHSPVTPILQTARLWLRPLELADAAQAQLLFPRWQIVRYLAAVVPWPYPPDGAHTYFRDMALPAVARGEAWHWTIRLKGAPDHLIGAINLSAGKRENRGFWIGVPWQGRGYATEACAAATAFWFEALRFPALRVGKAILNEPSRRVSQREGMRLVGTEERDFVSGRLPAELWEITAGEWLARRGSSRADPTSPLRKVTTQRIAEVEGVLRAVAAWAAAQPDVCGLALVGSWARGDASMESDVDLIVLSDEITRFTERDGWWSFLGDAKVVRTQAWGNVVERRLRLASAVEVEFGIAPRAWTQVPLDAGTRRVLSNGVLSLHDPEGLLHMAIASLEA